MTQPTSSSYTATDDLHTALDKLTPLPNGHSHPTASAPTASGSDPPSAAFSLSSLHSDVHGLYSFLDLNSQQDHGERASVLSNLTSVIHALYPAAEVKSIGSCATELFLPDSDLDLLVRHPPHYPPLTISDLHAMGHALQPLCSSLQIISTASVPLIKLTADTVTVDITLNVDTGHRSTRLMQAYIDHFPVLRPLVLIIKQLLKARGLNDLYSGGLPSYTLILMVVSMLQMDEQGRLDIVTVGHEDAAADPEQQPVKPLSTNRKGSSSSESHPTSPATPIPATVPSSSSTSLHPSRALPPDLGMYLLSFLHLYGHTFDYGSLGISVRPPGHYFHKAQRQWLHPHNPQLLCVENPLDPGIDLGFKVFNISEVVARFRDAYQQLTQDQPVSIRRAAGTVEGDGELQSIADEADKEEPSADRCSTPLVAVATAALPDLAQRSPSPQQLPSAPFDHMRVSSAPHTLINPSGTPSSLSTSTPSSASSATSSHQTPSRASTTSPASPSMKHPAPTAAMNGFQYPPPPLAAHTQPPMFYAPPMYPAQVGHPVPASLSTVAVGPTAGSSSASTVPNGVCHGPCCFPPSHVLVYDRQGNLVYVPASFASQMQQVNAAQLAMPNGNAFSLYPHTTPNGLAHLASQQQQQHQQQQQQQSQALHQTSAYTSQSPQLQPSPSYNPPQHPHSSAHSNGGNSSNGSGGSSSKPYMNGHGGGHGQSPNRSQAGAAGDKQRSSRSKGRSAGGGGGKSRGGGHGTAGAGQTTQVDNDNPYDRQW